MFRIINHFSSSDHHKVTDPHPRQMNLPAFTDIAVKTTAFSIDMHAGNAYHVTIMGKNKDAVKVEVADQKLVIIEKRQHLQSQSFIDYPRIIITVPAAAQLKQADFANSAGGLSLTELAFDELNIDMDAGSSTLSKVTVQRKTTAVLNAGSLKISDSALTIQAEVNAGSVKLDTHQLRGQNRLTLTAGSLSLTESPDVGYDLAASVGTITYHGQRVGHHFSKNLSSVNKLTVLAAAGSVKIN
ncbi:DUF4097 family beta strand repeat-containing protein [Lactobacillus xylocopicola]|uniref:DUF4097 domain-containing protein n=1 Tax=Lactobacillus xylocopicola TaxID=2976676 RepID=A0ABN6SIE7_9LACO|nr:DUF4097 family beta strand repeat-containing protein [Lactobacillus xylocopicola]BDR59824.1 hypothetical protein KIM322_00850 [Lactobacillus xylocopicola]